MTGHWVIRAPGDGPFLPFSRHFSREPSRKSAGAVEVVIYRAGQRSCPILCPGSHVNADPEPRLPLLVWARAIVCGIMHQEDKQFVAAVHNESVHASL